ncbi:hypothetical protein IFHNHDMJ_00601 [Synechococcus sp. CBW1107]|nr:hypothetical protein IFHNHDMJ_00601 [Synechococcus sp. CBW1107]
MAIVAVNLDVVLLLKLFRAIPSLRRSRKLRSKHAGSERKHFCH